MFVLGNFLRGIAAVLDIVLYSYMIIVIARAVISWVSPDPYNPIVRFLHQVTEPLLYRIRRLIRIQTGPIDFSPLLLILLIIFLQKFLVQTLDQLASRLTH